MSNRSTKVKHTWNTLSKCTLAISLLKKKPSYTLGGDMAIHLISYSGHFCFWVLYSWYNVELCTPNKRKLTKIYCIISGCNCSTVCLEFREGPLILHQTSRTSSWVIFHLVMATNFSFMTNRQHTHRNTNPLVNATNQYLSVSMFVNNSQEISYMSLDQRWEICWCHTLP